MGIFSKLADKLDDARYEAKRSLKKARKKNDVDSNFDLATKAAGDVLGKFADAAGKAGKVAYEKMDELNQEMQSIYAEYSCYDDRTLKKIFRSSTGVRKIVSGKILNERGYGK